MRRRGSGVASVIAAAIVVLLAALPALADGKVFATFDHRASIPDQQALIAYKDGIQTLAIETKFTGTGTDFAWVVPLPAPPEISAATTGLFPSLRAMMAPNVETGGWKFGVWLVIITTLLVAVFDAKGSTRFVRACAAVCCVSCMGLALLPSLGEARGVVRGEGGAGVEVVDRRIVGSFETTTITGDSAEPLMVWLKDNGFEQPTAARPVIQDYAARGWCFVAAKLRRAEDGGTSTPHPLVFRFPATAPVYPMKLTGVENGPVTVELYIFGPGSASAAGLETIWSRAVEYEPAADRLPSDWAISHSAIIELAAGLPAATCLKGTLQPRQMTADVAIEFGPVEEYRKTVFTPSAAWGLGFDAGVLSFCVFTAAIGAVMAVRRLSDVPLRRPALYALLPAAAVWVGTGLGLPKAPALFGPRARLVAWRLGDGLASAFEGKAQDDPALEPSLEWAKREMPRIAELAGLPYSPREEDSPGNYTLRRTDEGLEFRWYDGSAREGLFVISRPAVNPPSAAPSPP